MLIVIAIVIFIICYTLSSLDTTIDTPTEKPSMILREDMEFADLVSSYLKGEDPC